MTIEQHEDGYYWSATIEVGKTSDRLRLKLTGHCINFHRAVEEQKDGIMKMKEISRGYREEERT